MYFDGWDMFLQSVAAVLLYHITRAPYIDLHEACVVAVIIMYFFIKWYCGGFNEKV